MWAATPNPQVINADVPKRSYWRVVIGSAAATQQLSTVIAASVVPVHLRRGTFGAQPVLVVAAAMLAVGALRALLSQQAGVLGSVAVVAGACTATFRWRLGAFVLA